MRFVLAVLTIPAFAAAGLAQPGLTQPGLAQPVGAGKPILVVETGGHSAQIEQLLFTPQSKELITVSLDKTVRVWDVGTGACTRTIRTPIEQGVFGELWAAALSADGKILAVGGHGFPKPKIKLFPIFLIDLASGQIIRAIDFPYHRVRTLAFSGKTLAAAGDQGKIVLYNAETGEKTRELDGHKGSTHQVVFSPDGTQLASLGQDKIGRIWSLDTGKNTAELKLEKMSVWRTIAWSPDGKSIATGVSDDGDPLSQFFAVWTPDGQLARRIYHSGKRRMYVGSLAFTPDSTGIVEAGEDGLIAYTALWDAVTGEKRQTFFRKNNRNLEAARYPAVVAPNGKIVAVAGDRNHRTYLYAVGGKLLRTLGGRGTQISEVAWVKNEQQPLQIVWRTQLLNDKVRDLQPSDLGKEFFQYAFNLDEMQLAPVPPPPYRLRQYASKEVMLIWDGPRLQVQRDGAKTLNLRPPGNNEDPIHARAVTLVSPDHVAIAKRDVFYLFDTKTGKQEQVFQGPDGVTQSAAPSPDDRYVLAGGDDQVLRIWKLSGGLPMLSVFVAGRDWVAWTRHGYYAGTPGGERLVGWHVNNGYHATASFYPADRFRKQFYRPDIIALVLEKGSVVEAVKAANAALAAQGKKTRAADIDALLPPRAALVVTATKLPQVTVKASASAVSKEQPVTSVRLFLDGRPIPGQQTTATYAAGKDKVEVEWTITLPEGTHQLSLMARSPDVSAFSESVTVSNKTATQGPTLHVLAVGISRYNDKSLRLDFADKDAAALAAGFDKHCKGLFSKVAPRTLIDKQASRQAVLNQIEAVRKQAKENDLFVLTFAGHGVKAKDQFFLLTVEADVARLATTALSGDDVRKALAEFPCQVLLMLDACHSAGFGEGHRLAKAGLRPATDDATRALTDDDIGVAVLCAAMGHEKAIEAKGNGLFTKAVLEALERGPNVPRNPFNQQVYVHHLHAYVFDQVSHQSEDRQHPFLSMPWVVESFPLR